MTAPDEHVAATRAVYDASVDRYVEFVGTEISPATEAPVDVALLGAFVEHVKGGASAGTSGRVADVGCGPGRAAAFLVRHGLEVVGFDVSPAMLAAARAAHPGITFAEGRLADLPVEDASCAGVVCWYSIIHTPPSCLGDVFTELRRVLVAGGHLLLGFQAGHGDAVVRTDAHGTAFTLTSYRHDPADVAAQLERAGLEVHATALRRPALDHEQAPQAFVLARRR